MNRYTMVQTIIDADEPGARYYTIDEGKLARVVALFNAQADSRATDDLIRGEICADWHEGDEHQGWIDSAEPQEIADWLATFYQS